MLVDSNQKPPPQYQNAKSLSDMCLKGFWRFDTAGVLGKYVCQQGEIIILADEHPISKGHDGN